MKKYYLHISYTAKTNDGDRIVGDVLFTASKNSLAEIRKQLKNEDELAELPVIISISELSEKLYNNLLLGNTDKK